MSNDQIRFKLKILILTAFALFAFVVTAPSQENQLPGSSDFEKRCYSCHNIGGGDKKGPDLRGVTERRSHIWLRDFIQSPAAMNRKGDAETGALFKKYAPEVMPDQPLTPEQMDSILTLIDTFSKRGETFIPAGAKLSCPIQAGDIESGHDLFTGRANLSNRGAACIACHNVSGSGPLGGGTLGPDLTAVNLKYRDPELIAILQNPNFPMMKSAFGMRPLTDEEIVRLFAYFQNARLENPTAQVQPAGAPPKINFWFPAAGFLALVAAFFALNRIWRNRLRGVREEIVRRRR